MNNDINDYMIEFIEKLEFVNKQIPKDINQFLDGGHYSNDQLYYEEI